MALKDWLTSNNASYIEPSQANKPIVKHFIPEIWDTREIGGVFVT